MDDREQGGVAGQSSARDYLIDVDFKENPKTHIQRNFESLICINAGNIESNDVLLHLVPNGLCIIRPAPHRHSLFQPHHNLSLSFDTSQGNLCNAEMLKGRGPKLHPSDILCTIITNTNTTTPSSLDVPCCVHGLLVDVNSKLQTLSDNALKDALGDEYIAIVEIKANEVERLRKCYSVWNDDL